MANEKSIVLSGDNRQPIKQANHELFSYEMTQVILMLKGEFSPERAASVINPNLTLTQTPVISDIRKPTAKVSVPTDFASAPKVMDVSKPIAEVNVPTDFAFAPNVTGVSKPATEVRVPKGFAFAPNATGVSKPTAKVNVPRDFASAPKVMGVSKQTAEVRVPKDFVSAPKVKGVSKPTAKVNVPKDFSFAPKVIGVSKPTAEVRVPKDFVSAPSTIDISKPTAKVDAIEVPALVFKPSKIEPPQLLRRDKVIKANAPKGLEIICKDTFVYVPNTSRFDFWEDWNNSTVSKVFAKAGITIREG